MNFKKIVCYGLVFGSVFSLTSCSNINKDKDNNVVIENENTTSKKNETKKINNEIVESILKQVNSQIKGKSDLENRNSIKLVIENDTEYIYNNVYMSLNIKDNDGINSTADFSLDLNFLEPGQKCYADLYIYSDYNGIAEIRYIEDTSGEPLYDNGYTITEIEMLDKKIVRENDDDVDCIKGIVKNDYNKDFSNTLFYLRWIDDEGFVNDIGGGTVLPEFKSGESYYIDFYNYSNIDDINDKDNVTLKIYLKK